MPFRFTLLVCCLLWTHGLPAQSFDPAQREDEAIERQKVLQAADQIELLVHQNTRLQEELQGLRREVAELKKEQESLRKELGELERQRNAEREAVLKEVAGIVAGSQQQVTPARPQAARNTSPGGPREGFEHKVEAGQSLWAISRAYTDSGNPVTIDEIKEANNLTSNVLRTGQVIFIPKK